MLLSKDQIIERWERGNIIIEPFDPRNLKSAQYDVTLGAHCYREVSSASGSMYNPFDENHVRGKWEHDIARRHGELVDDGRVTRFENIGLDEEIILVRPGELILAHTEEFIGGAGPDVTTMMKARSSLGRNFFEICRCAGMGDVGYFNRWTMEIANTSRYHTIPLVRGRRVAQILFMQVQPVAAAEIYDKEGKYQSSASLAELQANWKPEMLLPKQWLDRECKEASTTLRSEE